MNIIPYSFRQEQFAIPKVNVLILILTFLSNWRKV
jgi:hypothetical protein